MQFVLAVLFIIFTFQSAFAETVKGEANVVDGDTLEIDGQHIELYGVSSPETNQTCQTARGAMWKCGLRAKQHLNFLVKGKTVTCISVNKDAKNHLAARCSTPDRDINFLMVRSGLSWAYRQFTHDYSVAEEQAKYEKRGIWQGPSKPAWLSRGR